MYSKSFDYHDYAYLAPYIAKLDELAKTIPHRLDHELRLWEYAMCASALFQSGCKTVLDVGGAGSLLAPLLRELGMDVTVVDNHPDIDFTQRCGFKTIVSQFDGTRFAPNSFDAVVAISVIEHVPDDHIFFSDMLYVARKCVFLSTDLSKTGEVFSEHHLRTYTPEALWTLHKVATDVKLRSPHRPVYHTNQTPVFGQYTFGTLCLMNDKSTRPYPITVASIIRNGAKYVDRYLAQVRSLFHSHAFQGSGRLVVVEGDSTDGTYELLCARRSQMETDSIRMDVIKYDTGKPMFGSVDSDERWLALEDCWNEAVWHIGDSKYVMLIESDLIWQPSNALEGIRAIQSNLCDVYYPLLMAEKNVHWMHDINGFRKQGVKFLNNYPYYAKMGDDGNVTEQWRREQQYIHDLDTGGGMILFEGKHLNKVLWRDKCRAHFNPQLRLTVDMFNRIYHP